MRKSTAVGFVAVAVAFLLETATCIGAEDLDDGTVAGWAAALRDGKPQRFQAASRLSDFGEAARAAVPELVAAARTGNESLRQAVVQALVEIGAAEDVTTPILIEAFLKQGCDHLTGMGNFGRIDWPDHWLQLLGAPAVPALVEILNRPNDNMSVCAAEMLGRIGPAAAPAVPDLIRAVEAGRATQYHVWALGRIGPAAKAAAPALNRLFDDWSGPDGDSSGRSKIVEALGRLDAPPVEKLVDLLLRDQEDSAPLEDLCRLGPKAREAAPALRAALGKERAFSARLDAAVALAHVDTTSAEAVPILIEALDHWNPPETDQDWYPLEYTISTYVPMALTSLGPTARPALPKMTALAERGEANEHLVLALVQVDPEGSAYIPALIKALKAEDSDVGAIAAMGLGVIGPRAKQAGPALAGAIGLSSVNALNDGRFDRDWCLVQAIRRIRPDPKAVVPILAEILNACNDRTWQAGSHAAEAIGSFGPAAEPAVPALTKAIGGLPKDFDGVDPRPDMARALSDIGPGAKAAVPALRALLDDRQGAGDVNVKLVEALVRLVPEDRDAFLRPRRWGYPWDVARLRVALGLTPGVRAEAVARREIRAIEDSLAWYGVDPIEPGWLNLEWRFDRLARLGSAARPIVPRLGKFRDHPNLLIRSWARDALDRIAAAK